MALKIMSLTDAAAERVREIMAGSDKPVAGVRVGIKPERRPVIAVGR